MHYSLDPQRGQSVSRLVGNSAYFECCRVDNGRELVPTQHVYPVEQTVRVYRQDKLPDVSLALATFGVFKVVLLLGLSVTVSKATNHDRFNDIPQHPDVLSDLETSEIWKIKIRSLDFTHSHDSHRINLSRNL